MEEQNTTVNEERIRKITQLYYSNQEVQEAIFSFASNREIVPRFFEGFGKRPDSLQYPSEIISLVKKGATSFHSSEERWSAPLDIAAGMSREQLDSLRIGWDLLIDIDSPYLDYSKICASLIIDALHFHHIKEIGVKFSGSKGFHIIIPWEAFPETLHGIETKNMFPEWPRIIIQYLHNIVHDQLLKKITALSTSNKYVRDTDEFQKVIPDLVLVSSRHLFRMPYALHEKTTLVSAVIFQDKISEFQPQEANPLRVKIHSFIPKVKKDEAKELLVQALDWHNTQKEKSSQYEYNNSQVKEKTPFQPLQLSFVSENYYPEAVKKILHGMQDGKKRGLFILINFFRTLGMSSAELEKAIKLWNEKNTPPLREGYIKAQLLWAARNKIIPPPNFSNPIYKDLGIFNEFDVKIANNPIKYVLKKLAFAKQREKNIPKKRGRRILKSGL